MVRENKSFRKFARKHLAGTIERRRKTAAGRKEMKERVEKKKIRDAKVSKKEREEHAADVAKLKDSDPEFYSFLETEDPTLLEYGRVGVSMDDDDEGADSDNEFVDEDDDMPQDAAAAAAGKSGGGDKKQRQKKVKKFRSAAAEDDGMDAISDDDTDVDEDELQDDDDSDDAEGEDAAGVGENSDGKNKKGELLKQQKLIGVRINAAEVQQLSQTKDMQHAVNLFVCAARELHTADLKLTHVRPHEVKLLARKFDQPELVKECMYTVARLVASGAAAALISPQQQQQQNVQAAASAKNGKKNSDDISKKKAKKKGADDNDDDDEDVGDAEGKNGGNKKTGGGLFINGRAKAVVSRYVHTAAAVLADMTKSDESLAAVIAHSLRGFVRVLHAIRGATKRVLRSCFALCTANQETARSAGFIVVLAVAKRSAGTHSLYQSALFKGLFLTLIRSVQQYTARSMSKVAFLLNAMVELYGTDLEAAYQHAFTYVRQLAVYLRAALQDPSQASNLRTVCNWQYVIALRTWAFVVSTYHEQKQLGPLLHPIVQVALGVIDVFASPRMIPLHLHVIETLNHVASRARVFIPVAPYLMRIVTAPAHALPSSMGTTQQQQQQQNKKKAGGGAAARYPGKRGGGGKDQEHQLDDPSASGGSNAGFTDLQFMLRVKKAYARSAEYIINVWLETLYLLTEHLAHMSTFISFPETAWQIQATLNKLRREVKVPKVNALLLNIVNNMETTSTAIKAKRATVTFGPSDAVQVKLFEETELLKRGTAMSAYYNRVRSARVAEFAAKQKALFGGDSASSSKEEAKKKKQRERDEKKRKAQQQDGNGETSADGATARKQKGAAAAGAGGKTVHFDDDDEVAGASDVDLNDIEAVVSDDDHDEQDIKRKKSTNNTKKISAASAVSDAKLDATPAAVKRSGARRVRGN